MTATLRMLLVQTRMNFIWYFLRDGEMIFWSLAIPVFFLFIFSYALGFGSTRQTSTFLVPGLIGAQVLSSGFWGVGAQLATFREQKLLRRIYLTPLPSWVFFAALVLYRMTLLAAQAILLIGVGALVFGVRRHRQPTRGRVHLGAGGRDLRRARFDHRRARQDDGERQQRCVGADRAARVSLGRVHPDRPFPAAGRERAPPAAVDAVHRRVPRHRDARDPVGGVRRLDRRARLLDGRGTVVSARYFRWI